MDFELLARIVLFFFGAVLVPQLTGILPRLRPHRRIQFGFAFIGALTAAITFFIIGFIWLRLTIHAINSSPDGYACGTFTGVMSWAIMTGTGIHFGVGLIINIVDRFIYIKRNRASIGP